MKKLLLLGFIVAAAAPSVVKAGDETGFRTLRERCSIASHEGVTAFTAGTEVLVLSQKNGLCSVKVGERTFEVELSKLTPRRSSSVSSSANEGVAVSLVDAEKTEDLAARSARVNPTTSARRGGRGNSSPVQTTVSTGITYSSVVILPTRRPVYVRPYPYYPYYPSSSASYKITTTPSAYDWHNWSSLRGGAQ